MSPRPLNTPHHLCIEANLHSVAESGSGKVVVTLL